MGFVAVSFPLTRPPLRSATLSPPGRGGSPTVAPTDATQKGEAETQTISSPQRGEGGRAQRRPGEGAKKSPSHKSAIAALLSRTLSR